MRDEDRTPVVVGVALCQEKTEDPREASEPYRLMCKAVLEAAEDAGSSELLREVESVGVLRGMWQYRNPARLVALELGLGDVRTEIADPGVLQLTPFHALCRAIAEGRQDTGVVVGAEAQYRSLRSMLTNTPVSDTDDSDAPPPDVHYGSSDPFCSELEASRGLSLPAEFFAVLESAVRYDRGWSIEENERQLAELQSAFSRVAAKNPHAWRREELSPEEIRNPGPRNSVLAFPYRKRHAAQWNVNQSAAVLVCSRAKARELGLRPERWVYPVAATESRHVVTMAQKRHLHTHPGTVLAGERLFELSGLSPDDLSFADLYSCFPSAVWCFAHDLRIHPACPWTVTGGMAFAGGPFNHYALAATARMAEVLRQEPEPRHGLVSNLSGIFGKESCLLLSNRPPAGGYRFEDVTEAVARVDTPLPLDPAYTGPATVAGYTVLFQGETPFRAIAVCDTPEGSRTVAKTDDPRLAERMTREEFCGRRVRISSDGTMS
ncbi:MAG: hypothetical protein KatS3mg076_1296 [Candidatus Binatia bacterium]|nr:MAG: hypothetical protein KatS3mg076_1296 [Candidatus Binatia bacterium]